MVFFVLISGGLEIFSRILEKPLGFDFEDADDPPQAKSGVFEWRLGNYRLFPYLMYRAPAYAVSPNGDIETDSRGFRSREFQTIKPAGTYRLFVVGGSVVWGLAASNKEKTFCSILNEKLSEAFPNRKIEVINAGQLGYNSTQEMILSTQELAGYDPDFILFFDGFNDINSSINYFENINPPGSYWTVPHDYHHMKGVIEISTRGFKMPIFSILSHSHFLRIAYALIAGEEPAEIPRSEMERNGAHIVAKYHSNLSDAFVLLKKRKIATGVVVQPMLAIDKIPSFEEAPLLKPWESERHKVMVEYYPKMADAAKQASAEFQNLFADFIPIYKDIDDTVYSDPVHPNDLGNEIIAEKLAEILIPIIRQSAK